MSLLFGVSKVQAVDHREVNTVQLNQGSGRVNLKQNCQALGYYWSAGKRQMKKSTTKQTDLGTPSKKNRIFHDIVQKGG